MMHKSSACDSVRDEDRGGKPNLAASHTGYMENCTDGARPQPSGGDECNVIDAGRVRMRVFGSESDACSGRRDRRQGAGDDKDMPEGVRHTSRRAAWTLSLMVIVVLLLGKGADADPGRKHKSSHLENLDGRRAETPFDENRGNAIATAARLCENGKYCSRCDNSTSLWYSGRDPSWITLKQIFDSKARPEGLEQAQGQEAPVTKVNGQSFEGNQYHYFEFIVQGGDATSADDSRRDTVHFTLVSPASVQVTSGRVGSDVKNAGLKPAYDFFVGRDCIPQERYWNNQGYGNINANELVKSIVVNVTRDGRYFIALQSRYLRYGVQTDGFSMKLSRGSLTSMFDSTKCTPLVYRYPDEIARMLAEYRQTSIPAKQIGGSVPACGETPQDKRFNVEYIFPTPAPGLSQRDLAIVVGAVCGGVVFLSIAAGAWLFARYKRTTKRMAKFSSLSRGLPDALMDGEGQEVAV